MLANTHIHTNNGNLVGMGIGSRLRDATRLVRARVDHQFAGSGSAVVDHQLSGLQGDVLVYVHWSESGALAQSELEFLSAWEKQGRLPIVVRNGFLGPSDWTDRFYVERRNIGRDLAAYRDVWRLLSQSGKSKVKSIIYCNNSVEWFGLGKIASLLPDTGVFAATESFSPHWHFQTFFFGAVGEEEVHRLGEALEATIRNWRSKEAVVWFGELLLGQSEILKNTKVQILFPYHELLRYMVENPPSSQYVARLGRQELVLKNAASGGALNPTHHLWAELFESGFPGLKKDLLRHNPSAIPDLLEQLVVNGLPMDPVAGRFGSDRANRFRRIALRGFKEIRRGSGAH